MVDHRPLVLSPFQKAQMSSSLGPGFSSYEHTGVIREAGLEPSHGSTVRLLFKLDKYFLSTFHEPQAGAEQVQRS